MNLKIDRSDIGKVYSGKPGCMCGCRGKYSYASKCVAVESKARGYKVDKDEVSDLSIDRICATIEKEAEAGAEVKVHAFGIFVEKANRVYGAYFIGA